MKKLQEFGYTLACLLAGGTVAIVGFGTIIQAWFWSVRIFIREIGGNGSSIVFITGIFILLGIFPAIEVAGNLLDRSSNNLKRHWLVELGLFALSFILAFTIVLVVIALPIGAALLLSRLAISSYTLGMFYLITVVLECGLLEASSRWLKRCPKQQTQAVSSCAKN